MGAPIKINKDLLVITPNYTKKWLSEGQPKVSGLHSQVALPFAPRALPVLACQKARIYEQEIKHRDCPNAPQSPSSFCLPAQGCLILPLSFQDPAKETPAHFPINITPHTYTDCAQSAVLLRLANAKEYDFDNYQRFHGVRFPEVLAVREKKLSRVEESLSSSSVSTQ